MSRFHLRGFVDGDPNPAHTEDCDTADAALGIGRRLAAQGLVVFAFDHGSDGHWRNLALFVGKNMLPNRHLASADNPLLAHATAGRASRCGAERRHSGERPKK